MNRILNKENIKKEISYLAVTMSGGFLLGAFLCFIIVKVFGSEEKDMTVFPLGSLMCIGAGLMFLVIFGIFGLKGRFEMAVCMSCTRKRFLLQEIAANILVILLFLVLGLVYNAIESLLFRSFYKGIPVEWDMFGFYKEYVLQPMNFILMILIVLAWRLLFGTLFIKFGQIFFWCSWIIWMILCMAPSKLVHQLGDAQLERLSVLFTTAMDRCNGYFIHLVGIMISVVCIMIAAFMLRKQEAKGY